MARMTMLLFVLALSLKAYAGPELFSGVWVGQGTYVLNGDITHCSGFDLKFVTSGDVFTFESGSRVCEKHTEKFYRVDMTFKDGLLYFGNQVVGSYDGNTLQAGYRAPDGNSFRNWRMFMRREGNNLMYEESRTMDGETTPMISFSGMTILQ
jgi:hypothetical protein